MGRPTLLCSIVLISLTACEVTDTTPLALPPLRSINSLDTDIHDKGEYEFEAGVTVDPGDAFDSPFEVKLGFAERTEFFTAGSVYQWESRRGPNAHGFGDMELGIRHRFFDETDETPAFLVEMKTKLPTADESDGFGTGETDFGGAFAVSKTFDGTIINGFYGLTYLGDPGGDDGDLEHSFGVVAVRYLDEEFFAFGEVYSQITPEDDDEQLLADFGLGWYIEEGTVLDVGFSLPLSKDAPNFFVTTGFTVLF